MNLYEKAGLLLVMVYFGNSYPESWKGAEIVLFLIGSFLFYLGKDIEKFVRYK